MAVRQYVGARYVPILMGEWDKALSYEALNIVTYKGNSFTSKKPVPQGTEIDNTEYWINTGNYNAQVNEFINKVNSLTTEVNGLTTEVNNMNQSLTNINNNVNNLANIEYGGAEVQIGENLYKKTLIFDGVSNKVWTAIGHAPSGANNTRIDFGNSYSFNPTENYIYPLESKAIGTMARLNLNTNEVQVFCEFNSTFRSVVTIVYSK